MTTKDSQLGRAGPMPMGRGMDLTKTINIENIYINTQSQSYRVTEKLQKS